VKEVFRTLSANVVYLHHLTFISM